MASIVHLFLAILAAASASTEIRLIGGDPIEIQDVPYTVALTYTYPGPGITIQRCVGALISSFHVLTTSFCFTGAILNNMQVRAGSTNSLSGGTLVNIRDVVRHPEYEEVPRSNDIAVTFLAAPLGISNVINVLYLPPPYFYIPDGENLQVVSWGFVSEAGPQLETLKVVDLIKVNTWECAATYIEQNVTISESVICANAPGKGVCLGDSGAPMVIGNVLVGISSIFNDCLDDTYPDVFTRVDRYTNWIMEIASPGGSGSGIRIVSPTL